MQFTENPNTVESERIEFKKGWNGRAEADRFYNFPYKAVEKALANAILCKSLHFLHKKNQFVSTRMP